jgi:threonine dehydratase
LSYATEVVRRSMPATPQYRWPLLGELVGAEVWVKHENHTPTGAFKVRGGLVFADRLRATRPEVRGIVSATRCNHGQSLAYAGAAAGLEVTIVVPHGNSRDKNAAMRGFGAEVIEYGHDYQAAREYSVQLAAERGLEAVPPYHPDLVLGVATYARELFDAVADLDTVYVGVGMGTGIRRSSAWSVTRRPPRLGRSRPARSSQPTPPTLSSMASPAGFRSRAPSR